jgi:hypothetical protein
MNTELISVCNETTLKIRKDLLDKDVKGSRVKINATGTNGL